MKVEYLRELYKKGARVVCDEMMDDPRPIPSGTKGIVQYVDDACQIGVIWDNGRTLSLIYGVDSFHLIEE